MNTQAPPKFGVNTVLHTKDGRKIGNGIVVGHSGTHNVIKTDYGNVTRLTDAEIDELFYEAWFDLLPEEREYMRATIGDHKNYVKPAP